MKGVVCTKCHEDKKAAEFNWRYDGKKRRNKVCHACHQGPEALIIRRYSVTDAQAKKLLSQERCAICPALLTQESRRVDHCHETGLVRGVLCHHCNVGLGHFKEDKAMLERALEYLRRFEDAYELWFCRMEAGKKVCEIKREVKGLNTKE